MPEAGEDVILPSDSKVVIGRSVDKQLGLITIPASSELIFAENPAGIVLDISGMEVLGALRVGSQICRFLTDLTITLHGARPNDLNVYGQSPTAVETYKGISVNGGIISIHGKRHYPTWSRLAQTVPAGQDYLLVQEVSFCCVFTANKQDFCHLLVLSTATGLGTWPGNCYYNHRSS